MIDTDNLAHPNSLLFNAFPLYWPFKAYWFFRKVSVSLSPTIVHTTSCSLQILTVFCIHRLPSSSCSKISQPFPKVTKMKNSPASTSASNSIEIAVWSNSNRELSIPEDQGDLQKIANAVQFLFKKLSRASYTLFVYVPHLFYSDFLSNFATLYSDCNIL